MASNLTLAGNFLSLTARHGGEEEIGGCYSSTMKIIVNIHTGFLLIFGFLANLCSFAVLIRPRLRRRPTFSYLAFLSLSNALLSLIYSMFSTLAVNFEITVDELPLFFFCRLLNRFAIDFLTHFSLYTLTAVDLDRIRTVTSKTATTQRYSRSNGDRPRGCARAFIHVCLVELFIALVLFVIDFHWLAFYGYTVSNDNGSIRGTVCEIPELNNVTMLNPYSVAYNKYVTSIVPIVELVLFIILPFFTSTIATIVIIRHVSIKYTLLSHINKRLKKSRRRMELHLSILLISLNCVFIMFNTPHTIYGVYVSSVRNSTSTASITPGHRCFLATLQKSFDLLQQCYFMSTFFLYILTNRRFREEFYELLKKNLFHWCGFGKLTRSSTPSPSRTHRHHHHHRHHPSDKDHHDDENDEHSPPTRLMPPSRSLMETRFSVTDYFSQEVCDDDDAASTSKGYNTSEMRLSVNPASSCR